MSSSLSIGIIGLPNVGKSTLFNALTHTTQAAASNYPFCTIDPNAGIIELDDPRLRTLSEISKSQKIVYAPVQFLDIAGLVKGASKGEGLGNQFLSHIRETDALVHIVRCFASDNIVHVEGDLDPIRDIETIELELLLADLQMVENSLEKLQKKAKQDKTLQPTVAVLQKVQEHLNQNLPLRSLPLSPDELERLFPYPLLSLKKIIYVPNVSENDLPSMDNDFAKAVVAFAEKEGNAVIPICAKIEEEIAQLSPEEEQPFLEELGLHESGLQRLAKAGFDLLDLITFLTTGEQETRAWTIHKGTKAPEAAGKIHTDIQTGFIRAEVIDYDTFIQHGGRVGAKEAGKMRAEGKDYVIKDGDVVLFLHG